MVSFALGFYEFVLKVYGLSKDVTIGDEIFFVSVVLNSRQFFTSEEPVK